MNDLEQKVAAAKVQRPVYVYDIPDEYAQDCKSFGMVQLTASDELMAARRCGSDTMKLSHEMLKQALVEINGTAVGLADGSADTAFERMSPIVRQFVMAAYGDLHSPKEEATKSFLTTRRVKVA